MGVGVGGVLVAVLIASGVAQADEAPRPPLQEVAPWLKPWLPPVPVDEDPVLGDGLECSLEAAGGATISAFSKAPAVSETAAIGYFLASSKRQALSVEALESAVVAGDGGTPTMAFVGAGLRRIGRRKATGFGAMDFERIAVGVPMTSRGTTFARGVGGTLAFGLVNAAGSGLSVHLDVYAFDTANLTGPDKAIVIGVGYVYSPFTGTSAAAPTPDAPDRTAGPTDQPACPELDAYIAVTAAHRKAAVAACNANQDEVCQRERNIVLELSARLGECREGKAIGPPKERDDAPP